MRPRNIFSENLFYTDLAVKCNRDVIITLPFTLTEILSMLYCKA